MSLARLLTAAKALTKFTEAPSAYRMRRAALLPKFGGVHDPFASEQKPNVAAAPVNSGTAPVASRGARWKLWPWKLRNGKHEGPVEAKPAFPSKPGPTRAARTPVQAELTLDNVRVARNDLRESDLDVVARAGGGESSRPAVAANLMLGALVAEQALDRLADRIVGAEVP